MLRRTGFKSRAPQWAPRDPDRLRGVPTVTPGAFRAPQPVATTSAEPVTKDAPVRSEAYRRIVAAMPCIHCGIAGYSQHAHANAGKGKGIKTDDRMGFPLCAARPGVEGCHAAFDQYQLLPGGRDEHAEAGERWAERTRAAVLEAGVWPNRLPRWGDERGP